MSDVDEARPKRKKRKASKPYRSPAEESTPAPETARTIGEWLGGKPLPQAAHLFLGLFVPAAIGLVNMWRLKHHTVDDAYISYRYARNFARGLGLVYNQGEHIEGYTNFLWTVLLGAGFKIGIEPDTLAKVLGAGFALGTMALIFSLDNRVRPFAVVPCCSTWLLASTTPFLGYAVWGLETAMFTFCVVAGLVMFADEEERDAKIPWSGLVFAAAGLTRPEAPMYLGLTMLFLGGPAIVPLGRLSKRLGDPDLDRLPLLLFSLVVFASGVLLHQLSVEGAVPVALGYGVAMLGVAGTILFMPRSFFGKRNLMRAAFFIVPIAAHLWWRRSYYGEWLPNTLLAKTGSMQQQVAGGVDYLKKYIDHEGVIIYVALFGLAAGIVWKNRWLLAAAAIAVFGMVYVTVVGGDWMVLYRFMVPLQPFVLFLVGVGVRVIVEQRNRIANYGMLLLTLVTIGVRANRLRQDRRVTVTQERRFWGTAAGGTARWFREQVDRRGQDDVYGTIALGDIGQVGYETDFPILDLLGLIDPVISKLPGGYTTKIGKGFRDRLFDSDARYFILISAENDCEHPSVIGSRVIFSDARFKQDYALSGRVRLDGGFSWCIYEHKNTWDPARATEPPTGESPRKPRIIPGLMP